MVTAKTNCKRSVHARIMRRDLVAKRKGNKKKKTIVMEG